MGSGKGSPEHWVSIVKFGNVLYEIYGISELIAREAMRIASYKLPVKTKFIKRSVN
jgi:large subunit ribosomal protein L16